jgi:hypothetical protein
MVRVYFTEQNSRMLPQQIMGMPMISSASNPFAK